MYGYHALVEEDKKGGNVITENSMEHSSDGSCTYLLFCIAGHIFPFEKQIPHYLHFQVCQHIYEVHSKQPMNSFM